MEYAGERCFSCRGKKEGKTDEKICFYFDYDFDWEYVF